MRHLLSWDRAKVRGPKSTHATQTESKAAEDERLDSEQRLETKFESSRANCRKYATLLSDFSDNKSLQEESRYTLRVVTLLSSNSFHTDTSNSFGDKHCASLE